ncbi:hypothetical protein PUN4_780013 [Paraburkholderia unamae]|nr:hypothetical protein PUN4_780013 [Paraburkholderia unamae]
MRASMDGRLAMNGLSRHAGQVHQGCILRGRPHGERHVRGAGALGDYVAFGFETGDLHEYQASQAVADQRGGHVVRVVRNGGER